MSKQKTATISEFTTHGLSQETVNASQEKFGPNQVIGKKPPTDVYFLFKQFRNPLVFVLVIAILVTALMGDYTDAMVIALAVVINTMLGFIQERKAFKSLESLKKMVSHKAVVLRDGEKQEIDAIDIIPGDIVVLFEGNKVPADGIILENSDLFIEEAILTGESVPVEKNSFSIPESIQSVTELLSFAIQKQQKMENRYKTFMGTIVSSGTGKIVVTHTGMNTQFGEIAASIGENQDVSTPLEKKLDSLAKFITFGVLALCTLIFVVGIATQRDPLEMFTTAVAIAVAAIPEGLVIGLTAILAIGMNRILKRKGLVRTLLAAETLGSVTTVCIDKTGTLTEGKMRVSEFKTSDKVMLYTASTLANDRNDPIETARWIWAKQFARKNKNILPPEQLTNKYKRDASLPFSVERRFLAVRVNNEIFLAGAPEEMLKRSTANEEITTRYQDTINKWASNGKRLIGYGHIKAKTVESAQRMFESLKSNEQKTTVTWVGLMAFDDPVRTSVKETILKTYNAGVKVKVITGDYASTAIAVMKQIGIPVEDNQLMEGDEVESLSIEALQKRVSDVILFARTKPSHKLKIVKALKNNGEVIGMMGDGVNDAPALSTADIGIVVESASEVAKESSELILLDSNMNTIIAAIEEGRAIFDNLRKVILYLLSDSFSELFIILVSILSGSPLAITAVQILWINLINDGLPNLALTVDPKSPDLLKRKPLSRSERLINTEMLFLILLISIITAAGSLLAFKLTLPLYGVEIARTVVFAVLSIDSLLYVFSCRSLEKNVWHENPLNNKSLVFAVLFGFIITFLSVYLKPLQTLLGTKPLNYDNWILVGSISISVIIAIETFKWMWNNFSRKQVS